MAEMRIPSREADRLVERGRCPRCAGIVPTSGDVRICSGCETPWSHQAFADGWHWTRPAEIGPTCGWGEDLPMSPYGFIVELQPGCWLCRGGGDPERTTALQAAAVYETQRGAERALRRARSRERPFAAAQILPVELRIVGTVADE